MAVYLSIVAPPLLVGAVNEIDALVGERAVAVPIVGASGAVAAGAATDTSKYFQVLPLAPNPVALEETFATAPAFKPLNALLSTEGALPKKVTLSN